MKKIIYSVGIIAFSLLFNSCEKASLLYQGEEGDVSGIYFYSVATFTIDGVPLSYRDSLTYSFQNDPLSVTEYIMRIPVRTLGNVADVDREFKVKLVGGTAREGVDFEKLKDSYIIPAGESSATLPIRLLRTPILMDKAVTIDIQLVENENFKLLLPYLLNIGNNQNMDATRFRVNYSEIITQNSYYTSFGTSYFGDWSVKKFRILNDLMGWTTSDWRYAGFSGYPVASGKFAYAATLFKMYLEDKLNEGDPVYEDDGVTLMQLAPAYAVNYTNL